MAAAVHPHSPSFLTCLEPWTHAGMRNIGSTQHIINQVSTSVSSVQNQIDSRISPRKFSVVFVQHPLHLLPLGCPLFPPGSATSFLAYNTGQANAHVESLQENHGVPCVSLLALVYLYIPAYPSQNAFPCHDIQVIPLPVSGCHQRA